MFLRVISLDACSPIFAPPACLRGTVAGVMGACAGGRKLENIRQVSFSRLQYMRRTQVSSREHVRDIRTVIALFFGERYVETPANECAEWSD